MSTNDFTNEYKKKIDSLQTLYRFKGSVETLEDLYEKTDNVLGDVWNCKENNKNYCWNKEDWVDIGIVIDISDLDVTQELEDLNKSINDLSESGIIVSPTEPTGDKRKKVWLQKGKNLLDKKLFIFGYGLDTNSGKPFGVDASPTALQRTVTDYISVHELTTYTLSGCTVKACCYYNKEKEFISFVNEIYSFNTPLNCEYIRFAFDNTLDYTEIQLEQNDTATTYEEYIEEKVFILNANGVYEEFRKKEYINIITGVESETGKIVDGKKEYQKRVSLGNLPNATAKYVSTGLTNITITEIIQGMRGNESVIPFYNKATGRYVNIDITSNGNTLAISTNYDFSSQTAWVNLYYTKN